ALYEQDAEEPAAAAEWDDKELEKWAAVPRGGGGEEVDVAALLANPQVYFPQVQQQLQRERTAVLERGGRGNMSVDLCFVLDCTGSMAPFIAVARQQIHGVATSLRARLALAEADRLFLAATVRQMVARPAEVGRERLSEAMRICARIEAVQWRREVAP
ncbi:MAG: hypothetical protein ACK4QW_19640, partial [Alphaproteobacteria bacterium]